MSPGAPGAGHHFVVDHFEGDLAVVVAEGGLSFDLPRWLLPPDSREGDVLRMAVLETGEVSTTVRIYLDREATQVRRDRAAASLDRLRKGDPGGDLEI